MKNNHLTIITTILQLPFKDIIVIIKIKFYIYKKTKRMNDKIVIIK